jgi:hypothetical protein
MGFLFALLSKKRGKNARIKKMVDLELATVEQIIHELSNREIAFLMLVPGNNPLITKDPDLSAEMHVSHLDVQDTYALVEQAHKVMVAIKDGYRPDGLKIIGMQYDEGKWVEIEPPEEDEPDPWELN